MKFAYGTSKSDWLQAGSRERRQTKKLTRRPQLKTRVRRFPSRQAALCFFGRSAKCIEQSLCVPQVRRTETFGEPVVDGGQNVMGFGAATLVTVKLAGAKGGAQ